MGVRYVPSPNCHARTQSDVELLVVHNISLPPGVFGGRWIDDFFTNTLDPKAHPYFETISHLKVSAHLFIDRAGKVTQYVPFTKCAWHAGVSSFQGRENCNEFSIGIELEGTDDLPFTLAQYSSLKVTTLAILRAYPKITKDSIKGHSDIAPGRKTDPGLLFDWMKFRQDILEPF